MNSPSARLERDIFNTVIERIDAKWPMAKNLVISGTWIRNAEHLVDSALEVFKPHQVFIGVIADYWGNDNWAKEKFKNISRVEYFGNAYGPHRFESSAVLGKDIVNQYTKNDLALDPVNFKLFLCYQAKPHLHRQWLTHKLIEQQVDHLGWLSLQKNQHENFMFDNLREFNIEQVSSNEELNSKFCWNLGSKNIWQQHFLNIVSETFMDPTWHCCISEKVWKPIIGMRPFVITGHPEAYYWVKKYGFETFDEYWPHIDVAGSKDMYQVTDRIVELIKWFKEFSQAELYSMWLDMQPKLIYNQNRFQEFAKEQQTVIDNLYI